MPLGHAGQAHENIHDQVLHPGLVKAGTERILKRTADQHRFPAFHYLPDEFQLGGDLGLEF